MSAVSQPSGYRSYLLRFWQERGENPLAAVWRFSLEDPLTSQRQGFASLEALTAWLQAEIAIAGPGMADSLDSPVPG
jgi:hypothetical protein